MDRIGIIAVGPRAEISVATSDLIAVLVETIVGPDRGAVKIAVLVVLVVIIAGLDPVAPAVARIMEAGQVLVGMVAVLAPVAVDRAEATAVVPAQGVVAPAEVTAVAVRAEAQAVGAPTTTIEQQTRRSGLGNKWRQCNIILLDRCALATHRAIVLA